MSFSVCIKLGTFFFKLTNCSNFEFKMWLCALTKNAQYWKNFESHILYHFSVIHNTTKLKATFQEIKVFFEKVTLGFYKELNEVSVTFGVSFLVKGKLLKFWTIFWKFLKNHHQTLKLKRFISKSSETFIRL